MTIREATETVCAAALSNANGSADCREIQEAVEFVRAYVREQEES